MKKIILSGIMVVALMASTAVMAQDVTPSKTKKETKTEVKKEAKADDQKTKKTKKGKNTRKLGKSQMKKANSDTSNRIN